MGALDDGRRESDGGDLTEGGMKARLKFYLRRLRALWNADAIHDEIDEEMRFHIEMRTAENIRRGMAPPEAKRAAEKQFGRLTRMKEQGYQVRGGGWVESCWQDLRYAARTLRQNPSFTAVAIITLALGIGANTAAFSVVHGVLLKPLPFKDADRLMVIQEANQGDGYGISYPNFLDVRAQISSFEGVAVFNSTYTTITGPGLAPATVPAGVVSANLFPLLGASPILGRGFTDEEDRRGGGGSGAGRPLILSHNCWQRRFGADAQILGRQLTLDGLPFTVVGVMPSGFNFPVQNEPVEGWTTVAIDAEPALYGGTIPTSRGYPHYTAALARLKPDASVLRAQAELGALTVNLRRDNPWIDANWKLNVTPALDRLVGNVRHALLVLFGVVGAVLAIACVNVANLLLGRAAKRQREIAIRTALGASRRRIIRQLFTESILLGLLGGAVGLLWAWWGVRLLTSLIPDDVPRLAEIGIDWPVALFTLLASLLAGLFFGVIPALAGTRVELTGALKEGARGTAGRGRGARQRGALVVAEIALAVVLLTGAGLLLRSFSNLLQVKPGFDSANLLTFKISLPEAGYPQGSPGVKNFYGSLLERVRAIPGVETASVAETLPLSGANNSTSVDIEGHPPPPGERPSAQLRFVGLDYFRTLSIPLTRGRDFDAHDDARMSGKLIVNEAFAARFFSGENPLGRRVNTGWGGKGPKEIVGVVGDVRHANLDEAPRPEMYVPFAQFPVNSMSVVMRTAVRPQSLIPQIEREVRALDRELPLNDVKTLDERISRLIARPRFNTLLTGLFALLALALAAVGIYGVISYSVAERTHEIGIRMALGAGRMNLLKLILKQGMWLVIAGAALGVVIAALLTRLISSFLYGTSPNDPLVYAGVVSLLLTVALLACLIPARRATRVDPLVALRDE